MILTNDFKEFIALLNENNVKYLIVGGYAVAFHGNPRYTKDLDFWVWANLENAERMVKVLNEFGFESFSLTVSDFLNPDNVIQLGREPNRIDLVTAISGVEFEKAFEHRIETEIDGVTVAFIALNDLIENKKATGRLQDLADVEKLEKIKRVRHGN